MTSVQAARRAADHLRDRGVLGAASHARLAHQLDVLDAAGRRKEAGMREWLTRNLARAGARAGQGARGVASRAGRAGRAAGALGSATDREAQQVVTRMQAMTRALGDSGLSADAPDLSRDLSRSFALKGRPSIGEGVRRLAPFALLGSSVPMTQALVDQRRIRRAREGMLEVYPELQQADPDAVDRAFDVVRTYAPTIARSPVAAGAAVRKFVQFDAIDPQHVQQLLSIEEKGRNLDPTASLPKMVSQQLLGLAAAG